MEEDLIGRALWTPKHSNEEISVLWSLPTKDKKEPITREPENLPHLYTMGEEDPID